MIDRDELVRRMTPRPPGRVLHTLDQLLVFADAILERQPEGVLVEAGCYRGVSTARLSHLADMLDTQLVVFDSFRGLPANEEPHERSITGRDVRDWFRGGELAATLDEARATVAEYGVAGRVTWVAGWFDDTLPTFSEPLAGAYLDVDLAASTRSCLNHLWPLLTDRGVVVSQDGHLPLVVAAIRTWLDRAEPRPSGVEGLGVRQMVRIDR